MDKDELSIDFGGAGRMPLVSLSDTLFSGGGVRAWFVTDEKGKVTELVAETVEGQLKGTRRTDKPSPSRESAEQRASPLRDSAEPLSPP